MSKKSVLFLVVFFALAVVIAAVVRNTRISFDKRSSFKTVLPSKMRAAYFRKDSVVGTVGDKRDDGINSGETVVLRKKRIPRVGSNDVLVFVKSATLSQRDFDILDERADNDGTILCSDFSGIVAAVGKNVKHYSVGEKVFGIVDTRYHDGACADYVSVSENNIYAIPYSLSFQQAASILTPSLLNWFVVHYMKKRNIYDGKVFIDNVTNACGVMLASLLVRGGFDVTVVDDMKLSPLMRLIGVKSIISSSKFLTRKDAFNGKFDVVINMKRGFDIETLSKLPRTQGMLLTFEKAKVSRNDIRLKAIDTKLIERDIFAEIAQLVHLGKIRTNVASEYDFANLEKMYLEMKKSNLDGHTVINVN